MKILPSAPDRPLRDVQLSGPLLGMARLFGVLRILGGVAMATTYFKVWQVIGGVPWTGIQMAKGSPVPVIAAAGIAALGLLLLHAPTLARGMLSAAGTIVLSLVIYRITHNTSTAPINTIELKGAQVVFGFSFITLTFSGFADLVFHPILYMWQRRTDA